MDHLKRAAGRHDEFSDSEENEYHEPKEPVTVFWPQHTTAPPTGHTDCRPRNICGSQSGADDYRTAMNVPPRLPRRVGGKGNAAPLINRDLKPGRRPKTTTEQRSKTFCCSEPNTIKIPPRPAVSLPRDQPCVPYSSANPKNDHTFDIHSPPTRPLPSSPLPPAQDFTNSPRPEGCETDSPRGRKVPGFRSDPSHRLSLDLESYNMHQSNSKPSNTTSDTVRKHHEWPQVKGDTENYTWHSKTKEMSAEQNWYIGSFSRADAEHALHLVNREGAFLVRDCSKKTTDEPFVLAVFYDNRVFNIQIRVCPETSKYVLGTRLNTNDTFNSVADIIKFHSIFPIMLIDGRNPSSGQRKQCVLMYPVTVKDMSKLLVANYP